MDSKFKEEREMSPFLVHFNILEIHIIKVTDCWVKHEDRPDRDACF